MRNGIQLAKVHYSLTRPENIKLSLMSPSGVLHENLGLYSMEAQSAITRVEGEFSRMKKIMIAALSLSLLSGAAVVFAQDTMDTATKAAKKKMHHKKGKKSTATDTMSSPK
jgi:hypothetical protein